MQRGTITWTGYYTRYHIFSLRFAWFFINLTVTRGNALRMVHWEKMYGKVWSNTLKLWWHVALWPMHVCRVWKVALSFSNLNFSDVERVTTHCKTLQTWIGHNATRYHTGYHTFSLILIRVGYNATRYYNFNALSHALLHALPTFSLSLTWVIHNATHYHNFNVLPYAIP